jgi:hypothetical protein
MLIVLKIIMVVYSIKQDIACYLRSLQNLDQISRTLTIHPSQHRKSRTDPGN